MSLTPREELHALLKPILPQTWKYVTSERSIDTLNATTVFIRQKRITPAPQTPLNNHVIDFVVQVATPLTDLEQAEDRLDDEVIELLHALDSGPGIRWESAEKTLVTDQNLGYDITLSLISQKD